MFNFRDASFEDANFVASSWKQSLRKEYPKLTKDQFFELINPLIDGILGKSSVLVVCDPEMPKFIHGYLVYKIVDGIAVMHFAYVKESFRKFGVFKSMLDEIKARSGGALVGTFKRSKDGWVYDKYQIIHKPNLKEI